MGVLGDVIVGALQDLLSILFTPIEKIIEDNADALVDTVVGTPNPNSVFSRPTNDAWPGLYDFHWETMVPLALFLWAAVIGIIILLESMSNFFSSYHRSKMKKRAFTGLLGILSWWWIAALSLRFMEALTGILVPNLSEIALFETLSFSAMGVLGVVIALFTNFVLFALIAILYFMRHIVLYLFVLMMPILIVLWIPGVGPFSLVSGFMKRLAGFYVPFLFMTVPVALLFRLGEILGSNADLSMGGFGMWLTGLVIPLVAVVSPFVLFWQAGALFFMAERASHNVSARLAHSRANRATTAGSRAQRGGQNFRRGIQGQPAINGDGQAVFASGNSRAHRAGSGLASTRASLGTRFTQTSSDGNQASGEPSGAPANEDRANDFEQLRDRTESKPSEKPDDAHSPDDRPRYIN